MAKKEWVVSFAMLVIGFVFIIESLRLGLGSGYRPGMGFLPFYTGVGLSCVSIFLLIQNFLTGKRGERAEREKLFGRSMINVVKIVISLMVYALVLSWLGYLLSTFTLCVFLFKAGGFRRWSFAIMSALLVSAISFVIFGYWLGIRFPKGFLMFL
jgi:hypothetical protein